MKPATRIKQPLTTDKKKTAKQPTQTGNTEAILESGSDKAKHGLVISPFKCSYARQTDNQPTNQPVSICNQRSIIKSYCVLKKRGRRIMSYIYSPRFSIDIQLSK